jgi:hypothetical protein
VASISRTPSRWNGSPEWLAQASASSRPRNGSPALTIAAACSGLLLERGNTGLLTSPADKITSPAASTATAEPQWQLSTNPDRTTSATMTSGTGGA